MIREIRTMTLLMSDFCNSFFQKLICNGSPHHQVQTPRWIGRFSVKRGGAIPRCIAPLNVRVLVLLLFSLFNLPFSHLLFAHTSVQLVTTSQNLWDRAQKARYHAGLQILFPTHSLRRNDDVFSEILTKLPAYFPEFKLNTIGRGIHASIFYLPGLSIENVRRLTQFLQSVDPAVLEKYDLINPVPVLDPDHIEIMEVGHNSKFLALKPHPLFAKWVLRFGQMISEALPELGALNKIHLKGNDPSEEGVHLSLLQYGAVHERDFSSQKIEQVRRDLTNLIRDSIRRYRISHFGQSPSLTFDWSQISAELITAPRSIYFPAMPIVSYRLDRQARRIQSSSVGRLFVLAGTGNPMDDEMLEFNVARFLAGDERPIDTGIDSNGTASTEWEEWVGALQEFPAVPQDEFLKQLPEALRSTYSEAVRMGWVTNTRLPAVVPTENPEDQNQFFITRFTHPRLAPQKGIPILKMLRELGIKSTKNAFTGAAIYASSVRREVDVPGDSDVLISSLVNVPEEATTLAQAEIFAAKVFVKEVLGQYVRLVKEKKISFTELRMGSDATMGVPFRDLLDAYEANPYLTEADILNGSFRDKMGRQWSLERLLQVTKDFTKGKIDYFRPDGTRADISLQFLVGFQWRGQVYFMHRNGLKGLPSLLRTAVYDGPVSYAVAQIISRSITLAAIQRGSLLPVAIRELQLHGYARDRHTPPVLAEPLYTPKFLKKVLNFLILNSMGGQKVDQIFYKYVREILVREGRWQQGYNLASLDKGIQGAINYHYLTLVNSMRRDVNDVREFNERENKFAPKAWFARAVELQSKIKELRALWQYFEGRYDLDSLKESLDEFENFLNHAVTMTPDRAVRYVRNKKYFQMIYTFEMQLKYFEAALSSTVVPGVAPGLSDMDKLFIQTLVGYAPHIMHYYMSSRSMEADEKHLWALEALKIEASEENMRLMDLVSNNLSSMTRSEVAEVQRALYAKRRDSLNAMSCERALDLDPEQEALDQDQ